MQIARPGDKIRRMMKAPPLRSVAAAAALASALLAPPLHAQAVTDSQVSADTTSPADTLQITVGPDSAFAARTLLVALDSLYDEIIQNADSIRITRGEVQALLRVENAALLDSLQSLKNSVIDELGGVRPDFPSVDSIRTVFQGFLEREFSLVEEGIANRENSLDSLRALRPNTPISGLSDLEDQIGALSAQLDTALAFVSETLRESDEVGLETAEHWAIYDRFLLSRAAEQMGRLQLALSARTAAQDRLAEARSADADGSELDELDLRRRVAEIRIERNSESLDATADLLDQRGLPTATYRQALIQATGEVTSDVLDPTVAVGLLRDWAEGIATWIVDTGPNVLVQFLILAGTVVLVRLFFRFSWRVFRRTAESKTSRLLTDLLERMLMPVATIVGFLTGLIFIGIDPTAFIAGIGVLSVIVGLALQDSLANLAAGAFILMYRPFDVDDTVTAGGVTGTVRAMGLATTTILTFDNRRLFVPNSRVWGEVIENKSSEERRRVDVRFRITHLEDVDRIIAVARDVCDQYELILDEPETLIYVTSIDDSLVELEVRAWAATPDWWTTTTQLRRLLSKRLRTEGVEPPYPRQIEFELTQDVTVPYKD